MKSKSENIYCFDSSALLDIHRYYPRTVIPDLWAETEQLFTDGRIVSHSIVFDEIVPASGSKDEIARLVSNHKASFFPITNRQGQLALQILQQFPRLIDPLAKKDQADPWVIALVLERMESEGLFGAKSDYVVVSAESERSSQKIPAVCKHFDVRHMNLFQFFTDNGWQLSLTKKS